MIDCHWPFPNEKQTNIRLIDLIIEGNLWNQLPATMKNHDLSFTCYHIEILSASQTEKKMCNKILLAWTDIFNSTRDCLFSLNFIAVFMILIHIYHAKCIMHGIKLNVDYTNKAISFLYNFFLSKVTIWCNKNVPSIWWEF